MSDVRIVEVGLRDGLQNEHVPVPTADKARFFADLVKAGLTEIEATSFVHPKWVPQLADAEELLGSIDLESAKVSALVPNVRGLSRALDAGLTRIAVFTAASDEFTQKNINMSIDESLEVFAEITAGFRSAQPEAWIRGYVSTVIECPFAGKVSPAKVRSVIERLVSIGVDEVSLGETIGVAVPGELIELAKAVEDALPKEKVAWHFHDTRGTAIANVAAMLDRGYRAFDSSAGGLGGCPYAKGAGGNLATEDLVYFCERSGLATGVDLTALSQASLPVLQTLGRQTVAKAQIAALAACS